MDWISEICSAATGSNRISQEYALRCGRISLAAAKAMVFHGPDAHADRNLIAKFLPKEEYLPKSKCRLHKMHGGEKACRALLESGLVRFEPREFGAWTPGFMLGLVYAGAISRESRGWRIARRPTLEMDLGSMAPVHGRIPKVDKQGRKYLTCCLVLSMPAEDPKGIDVLAGVLAGGREVREDGQTEWCGIPAGGEAERIVNHWWLTFERRPGEILVSPFWCALLAHRMPPLCRDRWLKMEEVHRGAWRRQDGTFPVGQCPDLPLACWELAMKRECSGSRGLPVAGALPFGKVKATWFYKRGGKLGAVREIAAREFGLTGVRPVMREEMLKWWSEHRG